MAVFLNLGCPDRADELIIRRIMYGFDIIQGGFRKVKKNAQGKYLFDRRVGQGLISFYRNRGRLSIFTGDNIGDQLCLAGGFAFGSILGGTCSKYHDQTK